MTEYPRWMQWHTDQQAILRAEMELAFQQPAFLHAWRRLKTVAGRLRERAERHAFPMSHDESVALWEASNVDTTELAESRAVMLQLLPHYTPKLAAMKGRNLPAYLDRQIAALLGLEPSETVERIERLSSEHPVDHKGYGLYVGLEEMTEQQFYQYRNYRKSFSPPGKRGPNKKATNKKDTKKTRQRSRSIDPVLAMQAAAMDAQGHDWKAILVRLWPEERQSDLRVKKVRERLYMKVTRAIEKGNIDAVRKKEDGQI